MGEREERGTQRVTHAFPCNTRARRSAAAPPVGRCSCRLRSVGAVLMPNVFVPMHQPLLSRSKALAPPASWPGTLRAATSVQLSRALARSLFSLFLFLSLLSLIVIRTIYSSPSRTTFGTKTCACTCGRARACASWKRTACPAVRPRR